MIPKYTYSFGDPNDPADKDDFDATNPCDKDCQHCKEKGCNEEKPTPIKEFDTVSKAPDRGKCPNCFSGRLVALFGPHVYCNTCGYKL